MPCPHLCLGQGSDSNAITRFQQATNVHDSHLDHLLLHSYLSCCHSNKGCSAVRKQQRCCSGCHVAPGIQDEFRIADEDRSLELPGGYGSSSARLMHAHRPPSHAACKFQIGRTPFKPQATLRRTSHEHFPLLHVRQTRLGLMLLAYHDAASRLGVLLVQAARSILAADRTARTSPHGARLHGKYASPEPPLHHIC